MGVCMELMNMPVDMHIIESNDFFRITNHIKSIEGSEHPDIQKIKILISEGKRFFDGLEWDPVNVKIKGFKWNNTEYIEKELNEDEIEKQINNSMELCHYEKAFQNLTRYALFFKRIAVNGKVWPTFIKYNFELLDRVIGNPKISEIYLDRQRSNELADELNERESEILKLQERNRELQAQVNVLKGDIRDTFVNEELFRILADVMKDHADEPDLIKLIVFTHGKGSVDMKSIVRDARMPLTSMRKCIEKYPQYFKSNGKIITLDYKLLNKDAEAAADERIESFDELEKNNNIIHHVCAPFSKILKKNKTKE